MNADVLSFLAPTLKQQCVSVATNFSSEHWKPSLRNCMHALTDAFRCFPVSLNYCFVFGIHLKALPGTEASFYSVHSRRMTGAQSFDVCLPKRSKVEMFWLSSCHARISTSTNFSLFFSLLAQLGHLATELHKNFEHLPRLHITTAYRLSVKVSAFQNLWPSSVSHVKDAICGLRLQSPTSVSRIDTQGLELQGTINNISGSLTLSARWRPRDVYCLFAEWLRSVSYASQLAQGGLRRLSLDLCRIYGCALPSWQKSLSPFALHLDLFSDKGTE